VAGYRRFWTVYPVPSLLLCQHINNNHLEINNNNYYYYKCKESKNTRNNDRMKQMFFGSALQ
jgi:hypothetical protein